MSALARIAKLAGMTDEVWRRHANPWSVADALCGDSGNDPGGVERVWIGWWALVPVIAVSIWLWLNPRVFPAITEPHGWAAKGIFGEKLWLEEPSTVPAACRMVLRWLIVPGLCGTILLVWGLVELQIWPTVFGAALIVFAQLWRIDRLGRLYERRNVVE